MATSLLLPHSQSDFVNVQENTYCKQPWCVLVNGVCNDCKKPFPSLHSHILSADLSHLWILKIHALSLSIFISGIRLAATVRAHHSKQSLRTMSVCSTITPFCLWKPAKCCLSMKYGEAFILILQN